MSRPSRDDDATAMAPGIRASGLMLENWWDESHVLLPEASTPSLPAAKSTLMPWDSAVDTAVASAPVAGAESDVAPAREGPHELLIATRLSAAA